MHAGVWLSIPFSRRVVTADDKVVVAAPHEFRLQCWWMQVVHRIKGPVEVDLCRSTTLVMSDHGIEVFFEGATLCSLSDTMVGGYQGQYCGREYGAGAIRDDTMRVSMVWELPGTIWWM